MQAGQRMKASGRPYSTAIAAACLIAMLAFTAAAIAQSRPSTMAPRGALARVAQEVIDAYREKDAARILSLLAPRLQAIYGQAAVEERLLHCRGLLHAVEGIKGPFSGSRHHGFFEIAAEPGPMAMLLEIDPEARILHLVVTDDFDRAEQPCRLTYLDGQDAKR
jgi:hypothetical protein